MPFHILIGNHDFACAAFFGCLPSIELPEDFNLTVYEKQDERIKGPTPPSYGWKYKGNE